MKIDIRRQILTLSLSGVLGALSGPALNAQTPSDQTATTASSAAAGVRTDVSGDRQQLQTLQQKAKQDKSTLKADMKQYGKNSPQVVADRAALKTDRVQTQDLRKDVATDRANVKKAQAMQKQQAQVKDVREQVQDMHGQLNSAQTQQLRQRVNATRMNTSASHAGMGMGGHGGRH